MIALLYAKLKVKNIKINVTLRDYCNFKSII